MFVTDGQLVLFFVMDPEIYSSHNNVFIAIIVIASEQTGVGSYA